MKPFLSVILPAHNEERRLKRCIGTLTQWLWNRGITCEIIVVSNGSTDGTIDLCERLSLLYPFLKFVDLPERGKGIAVRYGMLAAKGKYRIFMDVDLSTPLSELTNALQIIKNNRYDVLIGSRAIDTEHVQTTRGRHIISLIFHALASSLTPGIRDTQCGFKLFTEQAAIDIFKLVRINGMAFDVEALYLARLLKYRVCEMPVVWKHDPDSRVNLVEDSLTMLMDVLNIHTIHAKEILHAHHSETSDHQCY